jgi:hypothetical protein
MRTTKDVIKTIHGIAEWLANISNANTLNPDSLIHVSDETILSDAAFASRRLGELHEEYFHIKNAEIFTKKQSDGSTFKLTIIRDPEDPMIRLKRDKANLVSIKSNFNKRRS